MTHHLVTLVENGGWQASLGMADQSPQPQYSQPLYPCFAPEPGQACLKKRAGPWSQLPSAALLRAVLPRGESWWAGSLIQKAFEAEF